MVRSLLLIAAFAAALSACGGPGGSAVRDDRRVNPFAGAALYRAPGSTAARDAARLRVERPADAALLDLIARRPQALWFGDWHRDVGARVRDAVNAATVENAVPVLVAYAIPRRDCGGFSAGGVSGTAAYRRWIAAFAAGIGSRRAAVVLEPDALAGLDCLGPAHRRQRVALLAWAVTRLERGRRTAVYIDAGHSAWHPPPVIARRLRRVGVRRAQGFALNVSNFNTTASETAYGRAVSRAAGGPHFVIDTSRNGHGPAPGRAWCNPRGRGLGIPPTAVPESDGGLDALLWIKSPGESDGQCNGGPPAGRWWRNYALGLARRSAG